MVPMAWDISGSMEIGAESGVDQDGLHESLYGWYDISGPSVVSNLWEYEKTDSGSIGGTVGASGRV